MALSRYKICFNLAVAAALAITAVITPTTALAYGEPSGASGSLESVSLNPSNVATVETPRMLQGNLSDDIRSGTDVMTYLERNSQLFGLSDEIDDLVIVQQNEDSQGKQHYLLQQYYRGLPVYGKYIQAHVGTSRQLYAITNDASSELDQLSLDVRPSLDAATAGGVFQADVEQTIGEPITLGGQIGPRTLGDPKAELMVYPYNDKFVLAYRMELDYVQPTIGRWIGFIDAHTGAVLKKFSLIEPVAPASSVAATGQGHYGIDRTVQAETIEGTYYLSDKTKPMYRVEFGRDEGVIETYDMENPFFPVNSSWSVFKDPDAIDAHYFAGQVYDFYANTFNRDSLDGEGMSIISVVNAGAFDNAFWDGYEVIYGDGNSQFGCLTCAKDVIAHELTHGVIERSANLEYTGQSGALNESFADIMAAVFDSDDWMIGEDMGVIGGSGVLRDMANPGRSLSPQPGHMSEYVNLPEDAANDNGGVHINSGIPNRAAYLVAKGIDALPVLSGQGRALLGRIAYGALTSYLTPTSGFVEARDAFVLAAGDLQLPEDQRNAVIAVVKDAWSTVGLPYTSNENDIVSLSVAGIEGKPDINKLSHTVTFNVKYGTNLNQLMPSIGISPDASISPDPSVVQNFASPVTYTVTSQNGTSQAWTIQGFLVDPESANDILELTSDALTGPAIIDPISHRVTLYVEASDDVTALRPEIKLSAGATVSPAGGTAVNLGQPVTYTVTAQNGTTQQWTLTAVKDSVSPKLLGAVALSSTQVAVVFDQQMSFATLGNSANYKLESILDGYANPSITKIEVDCRNYNTVYLTTSTLIPQNGYSVTVSNLTGSNGSGVRPDQTKAYFLTDDTVSPILSSARVDGSTLTLTYNEAVKNVFDVAGPSFSVKINGQNVQVNAVGSLGRRIMLTLGSAAKPDDTVQVSYTPNPYRSQPMDLNDNLLGPLGNVSVINRTTVPEPIISDDWLRLPGPYKQLVKHPTKPIMYVIFDNSNEVITANFETLEIHKASFEKKPERLFAAGGKLYLALTDRPHSSVWWREDQTGSLAILDENTLATIEQFDIQLDPYDLVVDENGNIFVSSGSGQHTWLNSYANGTYELVNSSTIDERSYLVPPVTQDKIYTINTNVSPRGIKAYRVNDDGTFSDPLYPGGYRFPYHGTYELSTYLRISPDGRYLFNGGGMIFSTSPIKENDIIYERTIAAFGSIAFSDDLQQFYTLSGQTLRIYNYDTFQLIREVALPSPAHEILPGDESGEIFIAYWSGTGITIVPYQVATALADASIASPHSLAAVASAASIAINACPIGGGGGGSAGGGGGGGGVFYPPAGGGGGLPALPPADEEPVSADPVAALIDEDLNATSRIDPQGISVTTVKPDPDKLLEAFKTAQSGAEAYAKENKTPTAPKVVIPVKSIGTDNRSEVELPAAALIEAGRSHSSALISIRSGNVDYELPVKLFGSARLNSAWGGFVDPGGITVTISLSAPSNTVNADIQQSLASEGYTSTTSAVDFKITLSSQGISKDWDDFSGTYATRSFLLTGAVNPDRITGLTYDPATKQTSFVPAIVRKEDGKTYVDVKTPHNSIYTIASATKTFQDIRSHWAQKDIEIMAAKKVVLGVTDIAFKPDQVVTRAEFAALLVRALGIAPSQAGENKFKDVKPTDWHAPAVGAAVQSGLIQGYSDGRFQPNGIITRQEMAVMIGRAVRYAGGEEELAKASSASTMNLAKLADAKTIPAWASADIKNMLSVGIMESEREGKFEPTLAVTRAHAVVSLKRMLQQLKFMN